MQKKIYSGRRRFLNNRQHNNRNRNQNNRQHNNNVANRVMDSNGPAGRVKGTAQQLVDKYIALAEEQTGPNADSILRETLLQFAEHYQRILVEAGLSREQRAAEQESRRQHRQDVDLSDDNNEQAEEPLAEMIDTGSENSHEDSHDNSDTEIPAHDEAQGTDDGGSNMIDLSVMVQPVLDLSQDVAVHANMKDSSRIAASKTAHRTAKNADTPLPKRKGRPRKSEATPSTK